MSENEAADFNRGPIRLACIHCDTEECDGIDRLPEDWTCISPIQPPEEANHEVSVGDPSCSPFDWFTHLGICPHCQKQCD